LRNLPALDTDNAARGGSAIIHVKGRTKRGRFTATRKLVDLFLRVAFNPTNNTSTTDQEYCLAGETSRRLSIAVV
jgi:hypothetical protein